MVLELGFYFKLYIVYKLYIHVILIVCLRLCIVKKNSGTKIVVAVTVMCRWICYKKDMLSCFINNKQIDYITWRCGRMCACY